MVATWKSDLNKILRLFNVCLVRSYLDGYLSPLQTELVLSTHTIVSDVHKSASKLRDDAENRDQVVGDSRVPIATE